MKSIDGNFDQVINLLKVCSVTGLDEVETNMALRAQEGGKKITKNDQVLILDGVGLTDNEIGRIVGWPAKDVGSKLSKLRKANKK